MRRLLLYSQVGQILSLFSILATGLIDGMARCLQFCLSYIRLLQALCGPQEKHLLPDSWSVPHDQGRYVSSPLFTL